MDKLNFKAFIGKNTRSTNYFISITKAYGFGLSSAFCKENKILDNYDYALLLWDSDNKKLGIKFYREDNKVKGVFAITKGDNSAAIMALSWFKETKIDPSKYADKYDVKKYNDPDYGLIYYIDLESKENKD